MFSRCRDFRIAIVLFCLALASVVQQSCAEEPTVAVQADVSKWKELLLAYKSLDLPLPPADAPLVAMLYDMQLAEVGDLTIPLHEPRYLLGFLFRSSNPETTSQILIGTEFFDLEPDQLDSLVYVDPVGKLPGEIVQENTWSDFDMNAGLAMAVQCHQRGWKSLANQMLASQAEASRGFGNPKSAFHQPSGLKPLLALKYLAWAHWGNQLVNPKADRAAILNRLRELSRQEVRLQSPDHLDLIQALETTLQPSRAVPGSIARTIDELIDLDAVFFDDSLMPTLPQPLILLARHGWDAMPVLIAHLNDRRLTRSVSHSLLDNSPPHLMSVGEMVGILVQQLAGDAGRAWIRNEHHELAELDVTAWWNEIREGSEEEYLVRAAVPHLPESIRTYPAVIESLAHRFPQRLPDAYRRLLTDRAGVNSWDIVEAIIASKMDDRDKIGLLREGAACLHLSRQTEALAGLAKVDQDAFEVTLQRNLEAMPGTTEGRFAECEQVQLAQLCRQTRSLDVWHSLRDTVQKADVGVRMEIIARIGDNSSLSVFTRKRVRQFLLSFFEDKTVRDVATSPEKYEGCAAHGRPRMEVRNAAAYHLAKQLSIDISAYGEELTVTADDWQRLREQIAKRCEELWISADTPSPSETSRAKLALEAAGAILLETGELPDRRLTEASFSYTDINDSDLRHLRFLPDIEFVDLSNTKISDEGIGHLAKCHGIRMLELAGTKVTDLGADSLAGLSALRRLGLARTAISDEGLAKLSSLKYLEQLNLDDTKFSDAGLPTLAKLLSLEALSLQGTAVTDVGLSALPKIPKLAWLDLMGTAISDEGMPSLVDCRELRSLTLSLTKVSDAGLESLAKLPQLEKLYLFGLAITDRGAVALGRFPKLTFLSLTSSEITDEGIKSLAHLQDLETLHLAQTNITDRGVQELIPLRKLTQLGLSGTKITDQAIGSLLLLMNLERLDLTGTSISAEGREKLRHANPRLEIME